MRLVKIARYPVKSLQGEVVSSVEIEPDGVRGDRCWGIRDETTGQILTARRAPQLLFATAALASDGTPVITLPTGVTCHRPGRHTDTALSQWLDRPVRRFRPNLVVDVVGDGWVEDAWCGRSTVRVGAVVLQPRQPCIRCTMVTRPQPDLDDDRDIFRTLARAHGGLFGAWTAVATGGRVRVGDEVAVELDSPTAPRP
ncbi:MAG TPA: MOSC N-terminal beta barrel domain-containing protein [Jatrophihabitans sp.]|nr:MOSC N-terminal beta barrel domain-containing protein [Jatrophihabitans sp.]